MLRPVHVESCPRNVFRVVNGQQMQGYVETGSEVKEKRHKGVRCRGGREQDKVERGGARRGPLMSMRGCKSGGLGLNLLC